MTETTPTEPLKPGERRQLADGRTVIAAEDGTQHVLAVHHDGRRENHEPKTWTPYALPDDHPAEHPREFLLRALGEGVGAASACWANLPGAGEFDSARAKAVLDGLIAIVDDYAAEFASHTGTTEPAQALVGELAVAPGRSLAAEALEQAAYGNHDGEDAHDTLVRADTFLAWLRANQDDGIVDVEVSSAEAAELSDRISAIENWGEGRRADLDILKSATDQLGKLVQAAQTTADTALEVARTAAQHGTAAHGDAAHARAQLSKGDQPETPAPTEPEKRRTASPFDRLPAGAYVRHDLENLGSAVIFTKDQDGTWRSTAPKHDRSPADHAALIFRSSGLAQLAKDGVIVGTIEAGSIATD